MKKKLPLGISNFKKIITEGYHYVDKTCYAYELIDSGVYYFLYILETYSPNPALKERNQGRLYRTLLRGD